MWFYVVFGWLLWYLFGRIWWYLEGGGGESHMYVCMVCMYGMYVWYVCKRAKSPALKDLGPGALSL